MKVSRIKKDWYKVEGDKSTYEVKYCGVNHERNSCPCMDWTARVLLGKKESCKHLKAVESFVNAECYA